MSREQIGIIGVGLLGSALAERFLIAGKKVLGYDTRQEQLSDLESMGGKAADSAIIVAKRCQRVVLSLPNSDVSADVMDEITRRLARGAIVIDTTTGEPETMSAFGSRLAERGVEYLDATVGGSSKVVRDGEAIVMAGGSVDTYKACTDLFGCFAKRSFHLGPWGAGARMKLVLNLVLGLNRAVLAEGLAFARAYGVSPAEALEVLRAGAAYSRAMDAKGAKMLSGEFTPEARLGQHLKDVKLILAAAEHCGARVPLSEVHLELLKKAEAAGFGESDNSAVIKAFDQA